MRVPKSIFPRPSLLFILAFLWDKDMLSDVDTARLGDHNQASLWTPFLCIPVREHLHALFSQLIGILGLRVWDLPGNYGKNECRIDHFNCLISFISCCS